MPELTGGEFVCLVVVALLVVGSVLIAWAKAFAARRTGSWPKDDE